MTYRQQDEVAALRAEVERLAKLVGSKPVKTVGASTPLRVGRLARITRKSLRVNLGEAAQFMGISVCELSDFELGRSSEFEALASRVFEWLIKRQPSVRIVLEGIK